MAGWESWDVGGKANEGRVVDGGCGRARGAGRNGWAWLGSQVREERAVSILEHLAERNGVRATARLVTVNRNTVVRYARLAGDHARLLHNERVAFSPDDP